MGFGFSRYRRQVRLPRQGRVRCRRLLVPENSQEMATAAINNAAVKVLLLDNRALGMVHQCRSCSITSAIRPRYSIVPDFVKLADAYGWKASASRSLKTWLPRLRACLRAISRILLDVAISPDQNVYPMVAPGAALDYVIGAIDVTLGAVRVNSKGRRQRTKGGRGIMKHHFPCWSKPESGVYRV